jgi:hypothetical protein
LVVVVVAGKSQRDRVRHQQQLNHFRQICVTYERGGGWEK